jgi:hypothetical protein
MADDDIEEIEEPVEVPVDDVDPEDLEGVDPEDLGVEVAEVEEVDEPGETDGDIIIEPVGRRPKDDDEDDEEDLRTEDDVEADLDKLLKEKLASSDELAAEDEEETVVDDKTDGLERLQPRRPDEVQCTRCFLLVSRNAPGCPVEDDACPVFT